ncbi:TPA_exp: Ankyrin repeat protein [Trichophyton benhamiae CBS 112371]|uniref:Ankyrin repeat protein n=1 Tax=Arthroderma benhamiae (strain ATCC MYA-4681 / CBS 112371) TaxID=663331 RepID=D4B065_ARTBC|nr:ankyrin repeat protein [Trichophyton benhamiae CBS 112371]EFE31217.1 ankyrin repeat protein [Trichophyton benhamiae CBS 112371]DAA74392.1 TPA_exp: Ankyrin repeat protein [Trichophyton benhamiae CBS 112371]
MDPLSVTASIIAVGTVAGKICSAFTELRSLCRSLPGRLHALNNEVADLEIVLFELASLTERRTAVVDSDRLSLQHLVKQAEVKLLELQEIVGRLRTAYRDAAVPFALGAFSKEKTRLQGLQEEIRSVKCDLNIMLGASNSQDMTDMRLQLEAISIITRESSQENIALQGQLISSLSHVDKRVARVEELLRSQAQKVKEEQFTQVGPLYNIVAARRHSPHPRKAPIPRDGQLFIGCSGIPYLSPSCDVDTCTKYRASKISMEYWFPMGLNSTILRMQAGYQANTGLLFQLQTFRSVPDDAQCVKFALAGDIEGLKYLFANGLASPRDVSPARGYTLLRWALYGKKYATCEFLLHAGADPDYRPIATSDNSPRIKACHFILEGGLPEDGADALRLIARGGHYDDFIDESNFTQTHRIVLGLSLRSLEEEIKLHPEDINAQDSMGRTPLAWAAARGDSHSVVTLLSHGADPNIIDVQISGPVSNAAARGYTACVRLLLEAGAHPDPPMPPGVKKGSPLNVAARNATDILLLKNLLDFGADPDSSGTDGDTPLIHAARTDNSSFALLFLEYGADINYISIKGATPLTTAITYNSHNVLSLILDRWHEYSDCPRLKAPDLLQAVALYADVKTMQIISSMDHLRSRQDKDYIVGDFSSRLHQRPDLTEELTLAFGNLLDAINNVKTAKPKSRICPEKLLEAGSMPSLLTRNQISRGDCQDSPSSESGCFFSCPGSPVGFFDNSDEDAPSTFPDDVESQPNHP